jgi:predicted phosphoadenosine phosphosulfate sulfurtransferase
MRKIILLALTSFIMAVHAHDYIAQMKEEDDNLNQAWAALTTAQRTALRPEQRKWIAWKDTLEFQPKMSATRDRATYLWRLSGH